MYLYNIYCPTYFVTQGPINSAFIPVYNVPFVSVVYTDETLMLDVINVFVLTQIYVPIKASYSVNNGCRCTMSRAGKRQKRTLRSTVVDKTIQS